ncbi:IclR family transcriptional regulator [Sporosarcina sp. PTS2304]|uniref:IclR family transcriptional regulator n=1 Tax=Sporosarcina sp. PTS2304 TaxID=2283194 RepID=UPI0013B381F9|nr:IclR family transcriptional regulator [Sporosarcina sp. PTS2304]
MQTITRAMKIIDCFISSEPNRFFSITELSKQCDIPVSSIHRILNAMIKHELIQQDKERKLYGLGITWLEYGLKMYDTMDYVSIVRPDLEQLMKNVEASVYLRKPIGSESIIIERIDCTNQTILAHDKLGLRISLHEGQANLTMLAHMESDVIEEILQNFIPENARNDFTTQLNKIKQDGFAIGEDSNDGITTVAAPVLSHYGDIVGAVNVKIKSSTMTKEKKDQVISEVTNTVNKISWKMGYQK